MCNISLGRAGCNVYCIIELDGTRLPNRDTLRGEKGGGMTINNVPLPYQEEVRRRVENAKKRSDRNEI